MFGKIDQHGYIKYGINTARMISDNPFTAPYEVYRIYDSFHNVLYWIIVTFFTKFFSFPIESLRLLNFTHHILTAIAALKTFQVLKVDPKYTKIGTGIILLSPTLLVFDLYILRDTMIVTYFAISFYYIIKYIESPGFSSRFSSLLNLGLFMLIAMSLRIQLIIPLMVFAGASYIIRIFPKLTNLSRLLYIAIFSLAILIISDYLKKYIPNAMWVPRLFKSAFNSGFIETILNFAAYGAGLSFILDLINHKTETSGFHIMERFLIIDSILIPFAGFLFLVLGHIRIYYPIVIGFLISLFFYFIIYYGMSVSDPNYGTHFRSFLVYYYAYLILIVLALSERKIKRENYYYNTVLN